ncbi:hypothetical protein [Geomesophilobacter sediminis]|uniref:Uncharacterized protein n=1 Tax=Geomesophilobacter sediminis TaxID=2798584 RepID=A0A8J7J7J2_9BACT|nr:hypothetical protein [Geomesophilobacter sediminis]MBJ6725246.1 hypothetical protein [Geomesophilobacter sediminis]
MCTKGYSLEGQPLFENCPRFLNWDEEIDTGDAPYSLLQHIISQGGGAGVVPGREKSVYGGRMYRLILVLLLLVAFVPRPSFGDDKVAINPTYLPETTYTVKQSSTNQITMSLDNPFGVPEEIRLKFPVSMVIDDIREMSVVTGKMTDEKKYPITIQLNKGIQLLKQNDLVKSIDGSLGRLVGIRAHGTSDLEGNLSLVKLDGKELSEEERKIVLATFEAVSKSMKSVKSEPIGIGEKTTKTMPLEIPIPGVMNLSMEMTTNYELVDIKDGIADFVTTYTFTLAASDQAIKIDASGKGTGNIMYDVKKRCS